MGRRPALDGLRGVSVLLVIAVHVGLLKNGYVGVDVFFALSGFLITAILYEEWERGGGISLRRFYTRRARRLLPALMVLVAAFAALSVLVDTFNATWPTRTLVGTTLLFINNWVATLVPAHGQALGPLSPTWSLAQEGQFYLLWPLVLWVLLRLRRRPSFVLAVLTLWILALLASVPLMRHVYPAYGAYTSPLDRSAELLLGCAAAIVWRERRLPRPLRWPVTGWMAAGGLAFVLVEARPAQRLWYLLAALLGTILILGLLSGPESGPASAGLARAGRLRTGTTRALEAVLGWGPLRFMGRISYGIYLYHLPIYYLLLNYEPGHSPYLYGPVVLAASVLTATASWKLVELPIIRGAMPRLPQRRAAPFPNLTG